MRQKNEEKIIKIEFILVVVFAFYSFLVFFVIRANIYPKGNRNGQRERERERQEEQKK